jgi:hypothetical protein
LRGISNIPFISHPFNQHHLVDFVLLRFTGPRVEVLSDARPGLPVGCQR